MGNLKQEKWVLFCQQTLPFSVFLVPSKQNNLSGKGNIFILQGTGFLQELVRSLINQDLPVYRCKKVAD